MCVLTPLDAHPALFDTAELHALAAVAAQLDGFHAAPVPTPVVEFCQYTNGTVTL